MIAPQSKITMGLEGYADLGSHSQSGHGLKASAVYTANILFEAPKPRTIDNVRLQSSIITGASGGLGRLIFRWIANSKGERIVLSSRQPSVDTTALSRPMTQDSHICFIKADACALEDVANTKLPYLANVFHSSGVVADASIGSLSPQGMREVFSPKLNGWELFSSRTQQCPLLLGVLFSSIASVFGTAGQASYAAANTFLDSHAIRSCQRGEPCHSIQWGAWSHIGMAARRPSLIESLRRRGYLALHPYDGLQAVRRLLGLCIIGFAPVVIVSHFDFSKLTAHSAKFEGSENLSTGASDTRRTSQALVRFENASPSALEASVVRTQLQAIAEDVLGVSVGTDVPFMEVKMDSISAVELAHAISNAYQVQLSPTCVYDYPTISSLAKFLASILSGERYQKNTAHVLGEASAKAVGGKAFATSPIYISGVSSLLPAIAKIAEGLSNFAAPIEKGIDCTVALSINRWDVDFHYGAHASKDHGNNIYCRFASLLSSSQLTKFDTDVFHLGLKEAQYMDPHARLLLMHTKDAVLNSRRLLDEQYSSEATGVFVGYMWGLEYLDLLSHLAMSPFNVSAITGNSMPFLAGRLAYAFGWHGPCIPTDTACSSSLVATHLARESLINRNCARSVVGGANLLLSWSTMAKICSLNALSWDGRCKSFDSSADGYGRGEAVTVITLENECTRPIAAIFGTAVNSCGRSSGLTAPSGPSQQYLISTIMVSVGMTGREVSSVSVHGTGTALGDPIEVGALINALSTATDDIRSDVPLLSNKSCYGHTEGTAGLSGLLLSISSLSQSIAPPVINLRNLNPHLNKTEPKKVNCIIPRESQTIDQDKVYSSK